jgi:hypothetical protein
VNMTPSHSARCFDVNEHTFPLLDDSQLVPTLCCHQECGCLLVHTVARINSFASNPACILMWDILIISDQGPVCFLPGLLVIKALFDK